MLLLVFDFPRKFCNFTHLDFVFFSSLRGQTVHWIGAQFCACMFLDTRDKSLNMFKFCRNDQREGQNKKRTKGASLLRNPLTMHKMHSLASQCFFLLRSKKVLRPNYFLLFFVRSKKVLCPKSHRPRFYPVNVLILSHFNGNTICTLPSTLFRLVVCLPIGLLIFFS